MVAIETLLEQEGIAEKAGHTPRYFEKWAIELEKQAMDARTGLGSNNMRQLAKQSRQFAGFLRQKQKR